jgi:hypothetical protein
MSFPSFDYFSWFPVILLLSPIFRLFHDDYHRGNVRRRTNEASPTSLRFERFTFWFDSKSEPLRMQTICYLNRTLHKPSIVIRTEFFLKSDYWVLLRLWY